MKRPAISIFLVYFGLIATLPALAAPQRATQPAEIPVDAPGADRIVMVLDGEPFTQTELAKFYSLRSGKPFQISAFSRTELNDILHQFSMQEMVKREASAAGFSTTDADVEAYIDEIKKQNHMDEAMLSNFLKEKGMSRAAYVEQIKFEIVRNRLFAAKVRPKVAVTDEQSNQLEKEQIKKDEEAAEDGYVIEQLVFPAATDKDTVDRAYERAKAGEDMRAVGGEKHFADLGVVNPADLKEELKEVTEDMSIGDVTEPMKIDGNWIIQKRVKSVRSTSVVKESAAKNEEFERKFKAAAEKYLLEELPKKYSPEYKL